MMIYFLNQYLINFKPNFQIFFDQNFIQILIKKFLKFYFPIDYLVVKFPFKVFYLNFLIFPILQIY
jgi:hypothetical protein